MKKSVEVILDKDFTYEIDNSRRRTFPAGWRGSVDPGVADQIKQSGSGRKINDDDGATTVEDGTDAAADATASTDKKRASAKAKVTADKG